MTSKKPGKASPTRKPARKSPAPTKASAAPKRAAKPVSESDETAAVKTSAGKRAAGKPAATKTLANKAAAKGKPVAAGDPLGAFIAAAATALDLPVEPAWLPAIKANLEVTLRLGSQITAFELPDEAEPAPVFGA
jgi:hypothetical protein